MNEFNQIIELDTQVMELNAQIEALKKQRDMLKLERDRLAIESAPILSETPTLEVDGVRWRVQKGRPSVYLKENVSVLTLPENFIRKSPDKTAILKTWRKSPELVESFADIDISPDKLTYKVI